MRTRRCAHFYQNQNILSLASHATNDDLFAFVVSGGTAHIYKQHQKRDDIHVACNALAKWYYLHKMVLVFFSSFGGRTYR